MKATLAASSCLVFVLSLTALVRAGTYMDSAALLLDESRRSTDFVQARLYDVKLASIVHPIAEARVRAGRAILVPREVEKAHPHLLLSLEGAERAIAAAQEGSPQRFLHLIAQARDEERTYRAILAQDKLGVPDLEKCEKKK